MKYKTILVCGLPKAGKTYFSVKLKEYLGDVVDHHNADEVRKQAGDWDFSDEGRVRQLHRMKALAEKSHAEGKHAILDFICPREEYRKILAADIIVWANRKPFKDYYPDTTAIFEEPDEFDFIIHDNDLEQDLDNYLWEIEEKLGFDETASTALMIGRYQPWHDGHTALFKKALEKHGQVCIAIRSMRYSSKNPLDVDDVWRNIDEALQDYKGKYEIVRIPNIVDVVYGRDVGWTVSKIDLPPEIEAISATKIREEMKK